jgi:hypothetical protein
MKCIGGEGIAWHIRGIDADGFYGEIRYDMPDVKKYNCKFVKCELEEDDWKHITQLISVLEKESDVSQNIRYWSILIARDTDGPEKYSKIIAGYFPGDETKSEIGGIYKQLLSVLEKYLKPYYGEIVPNDESPPAAE